MNQLINTTININVSIQFANKQMRHQASGVTDFAKLIREGIMSDIQNQIYMHLNSFEFV